MTIRRRVMPSGRVRWQVDYRDASGTRRAKLFVRKEDARAFSTAPPQPLANIELFAWLGEDEYGSGEIGLKQGLVPAGMVPLVAIDRQKVDRDGMREGLARQARAFGKTVYLCRFVFAEALVVVPSPGVEPGET